MIARDTSIRVMQGGCPILYTRRGDRHYTALFSNTGRAHALGRTRDWVVLYLAGDAGEGQWTVVTGSSDRCRPAGSSAGAKRSGRGITTRRGARPVRRDTVSRDSFRPLGDTPVEASRAQISPLRIPSP